MSKLYNNYLALKKENESTLFLFKSGIFYIFLDEDATKISNILGLKLTMLNENIVKCGFPASALSKYIKQLDELNISYKIIDPNIREINSISEYVENTDALQVVKTIKELDLNKISPIEALNILTNIKNKLTKE